jgi:hypothetical protein
MVAFHGLEKLRRCIQHLLPKRKEVAQSAPDLQMVVGRGQIEREKRQGEASGLGTLSPGPPSLPPLKDSLLLLALPLLGGRAVAFSRGPVVVLLLLVGLLVWHLLVVAPLLGTGRAIKRRRRRLGAVRGGLICLCLAASNAFSMWSVSLPKRCVRDSLHTSSVERMDLAALDYHTRCRRSSTPWLKTPAAMLEPTFETLLNSFLIS